MDAVLSVVVVDVVDAVEAVPLDDVVVVLAVLAVSVAPDVTDAAAEDDWVSLLPPPQPVIAALATRIAKLVDMRGKELIFNMDFKLKAASAGINATQGVCVATICYSAAQRVG